MRIDYEISEQDYLDAQKLAIKKSPIGVGRLTGLVLPLFGLVLLIFIIHAILTQGFSPGMIPGLIVPLYFLSLPWQIKRAQKKAYAKATSMHGKLALEADETGVRFQGPTSSSHSNWSHFLRFVEDDKVFVVYLITPVFFPIPKRMLTPEQIAALRAEFSRIGNMSAAGGQKA